MPAIQSEEDYRRELQEERERNSKKESEKTEEDFYRDPITGESTKDFDRAPTLAELGIPEDFFGLAPGRVTFLLNAKHEILFIFRSALNMKSHITSVLNFLNKNK